MVICYDHLQNVFFRETIRKEKQMIQGWKLQEYD